MGFLTDLLGGGRTSQRRAATPENPRFDLNSPEAWDALGGERSATGEPVSADSALTFSAWYRGVSMLARDAAKTPCQVFRETKAGRKEVDKRHPAYQLLRWRPNEVQTAFHFKQAIYGHAINRGNGYAHIRRTAGGDPAELLLLDPDGTEPVFDKAGRLWYVTALPSGEKRKLFADDVFHVRGFGFDGVQGYPAFALARDTIGLGQAQQKYKAVRFKNSARPSVLLESPVPVKPESRKALREEWEKMHTGLENSHRTAILDNGMKANKLTFTAEEMQEVEQAGLSIRDAANFLGVPSSKLGDTAGIKYASKEQDDQGYLDDGLDYWFHAVEDEGRDKLLSEGQKASESHCVLFDRRSLIRTDTAALTNYWRQATAGRPWATPNEARHAFDMPPDDSPDSDALLNPLNMGRGGPDNEPNDPNADDPPPRGPGQAEGGAVDVRAVRVAAKVALADAVRRMVKRVGQHAERASKDGAKYLAFCRTFEAEHHDVVAAAFGPPAVMATAVGVPLSGGETAAAVLRELRAEYDHLADTASSKQLEAAVAALTDEQPDRLAASVPRSIFGGATDGP
jgi:HK97 family phage portal protein